MPIELVNDGTACLRGSAPFAFAADEPVQIQVDWDGICLSSTCTSDRMSSCSVTLTGQTVTIQTRASWTDASASGIACSDDCGVLIARCDSPPLAAGDYTFQLGPRTIAITVPSTTQSTPCIR